MKSTPYAAFGNVIYVCDTSDELYVVDTSKQFVSSGWRYFLDDNITSTFEDGSTIKFSKGAVINTLDIPKNRIIQAPPGSKWICIHNEFINFNSAPQLCILQPGEIMDIAAGGNVFLVSGDVSFDNRKLQGPYQLRVRTKDISLTINTESTFLIFK